MDDACNDARSENYPFAAGKCSPDHADSRSLLPRDMSSYGVPIRSMGAIPALAPRSSAQRWRALEASASLAMESLLRSFVRIRAITGWLTAASGAAVSTLPGAPWCAAATTAQTSSILPALRVVPPRRFLRSPTTRRSAGPPALYSGPLVSLSPTDAGGSLVFEFLPDVARKFPFVKKFEIE